MLAERQGELLIDQIYEAAEAVDLGDFTTARTILDGIEPTATTRDTPVRRVAWLFARGLRARLAGDTSEAGNLYLDSHNPEAMIQAFQTLVHATPFIRFGYLSAAAAMIEAFGPATQLHIIDIGIGSGTQWHAMLDVLHQRAFPVEHLRLTGIDVPIPGPNPTGRLDRVGRGLHEHAAALGIPFTWHGIASPVEDVPLESAMRRADEILAVNAAFSLHHVPAGDGVTDEERSRDAVLGRLRALQPTVLTLVEPDVEHNAVEFLPRIRASLAHFLLTFDALASQLPDHPAEREVIENAFFGREVINVVASEGPQRVERHEQHAAWRTRMQAQGWTQIHLSAHVLSIGAALDLQPPGALRSDHGMLLLEWQNQPLIAASAWQPNAE